MRNIDELIGRIRETVETHRLENEGEYCRWLWQNEAKPRKLGLNEYGCADAANILYTINDFVEEPEKRAGWIRTLRSLQDKETGMYYEETHHTIHTTAHCIAALELFDAKVEHPLTALKDYTTPEGIRKFLDDLDMGHAPWPASHQGAGIYAALKLSDSVDMAWERAYFDWFYENQSPETGLWKTGPVEEGFAPLFAHIGGGFHYLFNIEYAKRPIRYAKQMVDTCISLYENNQMGDKISTHDCDLFGKYVGFLEVDWVYMISRASRREGYREADCKNTVRKFAKEYIDWLYSLDYKTHDSFNDLHKLFGACCALAEIQQYLIGEYETTKPLRLVLDRRPFI